MNSSSVVTKNSSCGNLQQELNLRIKRKTFFSRNNTPLAEMFSVVPENSRFPDKITNGIWRGNRTEKRAPCDSISKLEEYSGMFTTYQIQKALFTLPERNTSPELPKFTPSM